MRFRIAIICAVIALIRILPAFPAKDKVEEVVFWYGATQDERAAYEQMIDEFNRAHPNIKVRGMLVPQKYVERKLMLSVAGGAPPDVVRFYTHLGGEMMSRGGLESLDDLIERDGFDLSDFYPVGIEQNTYNSRLYGIPWILSPNALFYNKKLFREAGLDPNRPPKTWKELEEYALKLTRRGKNGNIEQVGYTNFLNNPTDFHMYLWQSGGEPLTPNLKKPNFTSPEGIETLTWMQDFLIKEMGTMKPGISREKASAEAVKRLQVFSSAFAGATQDPFGLGKVAMRVDSPFRIPALLQYFPDLEFGIADVPYNKVRALEVVGNSLVIPRGSRHKEAAWEFIKFASNKEQSLNICKVAGRIPARISAATLPEYYNNPLVKPFVDQIEYGRTTPVAPGYREVGDAIASNIELALKGILPPKDALTNAAVKGQEVLDIANEDPNKYPMIPWKATAVASALALVLITAGGWWYVRKETSHSPAARREAKAFYLFLTPWLIGFVVLTFGSIVASLVFSLSKWDTLSPARFVGLGNFIKLFTDDPRFMKALGNTLYYAAFSIPLAMIGGLGISVLMNQKLRGISLFRTVYYLPAVVSGVATAILWQWIFNPRTGFFNKIIGLVMEPPPGWLIDPAWSKPAFIIMSLWAIGGTMIIYLAGLQGIPEELYEASKIDGASTWQRFRNVTLPLLTPTIFYQLIVGTMAAFQFFIPAYVMTDGGPEDSTLFFSLYLFRNGFEWMKIGYASAMAWILLAIVLVITIFQFKAAKRWVYYEGQKEN